MNILERIIKVSISKRKAVYLMVIIVFILAFMRYETTTKSLLPNAKFPYVSVYTYMAGASPSDMEKNVTDKIEQELNDVSDLAKMTSESSFGSSLVILKFKEGTNIDEKIRVVQTRIGNMKSGLPKKAETPLVQEYDINSSPIIQIEVDNRLPYADKKSIIKDLERNVKTITGVSKMVVNGLEENRIEVIPDIQKLELFGITESDVIAKIESSTEKLPLGSKIVSGNTYNFQIDGEISETKDIENLVVQKVDGKPIYIRDLCKVKWVRKNNVTPHKVTADEKKPILLISVYKKKSADTISINNDIKDFIKTYNESNSYGVTLGTSVDLSTYISKSIQDVLYNALSGLLSVVVVLFFFIGFREALIASSVIPITLIGSFLTFEWFDITLNPHSA